MSSPDATDMRYCLEKTTQAMHSSISQSAHFKMDISEIIGTSAIQSPSIFQSLKAGVPQSNKNPHLFNESFITIRNTGHLNANAFNCPLRKRVRFSVAYRDAARDNLSSSGAMWKPNGHRVLEKGIPQHIGPC